MRPRARSVPSPACGGGLGRGQIRAAPSPTLPRKRGRGRTESVARARAPLPNLISNSHASSPACRGARAAPLLISPPSPFGLWRTPSRETAGLARRSPTGEGGEAERRETRELARLPGDWRGHPARLRGVLPPLAIEEARLSALHGGSFRSRATLSATHLRCHQPSSWREVRSDLQVEPRVARVRNAFRPREPRMRTVSGSPRKYQGRISSPFLRPAPPKRCLARAPQGGRVSFDNNPVHLILSRGIRADHGALRFWRDLRSARPPSPNSPSRSRCRCRRSRSISRCWSARA
jgi:hypothetical protein